MSSVMDLLDVGQANEFKLACRKYGITNADLKTICETDILSKILLVLKKRAEIRMIEHLIDCDADLVVPNGWTLEEHKKGGQLQFDPAKIELFLSKKQQNGKVIEGNKLRKELEGKPVLNANVLDYLLAHPELIPDSWKGKRIYFWGTIFRHSDGNLCVRSLHWYGCQWNWLDFWLDDDWNGYEPAAVLAS